MSETTVSARRGLAAWSTRDLLVTLAMSLAISLAFIPLNNLYTVTAAVNPIAGWALSGLFALPQLVIAYIIRRPGTAMLYAFVSGLTWSFASPFGLFGLIAALIGGLMTESTQFAATRYRSYGLTQMALWSVLLALFGILVSGVLFGGLLIAPWVAVSAGLAAIATHIVAGLITPRLATALARTGVLSGTALGRAYQAEV